MPSTWPSGPEGAGRRTGQLTPAGTAGAPELRQAILAAAVDALTESGPARLSLRELGRRAGVSHAAPAHHFGDKAGLLTALAAQGYTVLAEALTGLAEEGRDRAALTRRIFRTTHQGLAKPLAFDTGTHVLTGNRLGHVYRVESGAYRYLGLYPDVPVGA